MNLFSVIVTYNPNIPQLKACVDSLLPQVEKIIIVKNSAELLGDDFRNKKIEQIQLDKNYGIAYAQNRGIERAIKLGAEWILLSDQDTNFPCDYIDSFLPFMIEKEADVFCPLFFGVTKKQYSPVMIKKFKAAKKVSEPVFVQHAISSGTIFHKGIFEKIGGMDEKLFIDYVDSEWCWRAVSKGIKILQIPSIIIRHQLGDNVKKIFVWQVTIRSDARYYYIIRNGFYLSFHCEYLNFAEKTRLFLRSVKFCIGVFLLKHNFSAMKLCLKAFCDGANQKLGEMEKAK
ncbi:MAG: glycosyltransferase family 2 protein [Bacteroides sp.]|nr:glycosyltransferase family 2 protein [Prevotella sp.]MCM1408281.1 glycosyltransferase family 2 protein [Treponema brennaborense]MCM1470487.1 glycosyltransferase family 2 protein [Bacteroides sp.]